MQSHFRFLFYSIHNQLSKIFRRPGIDFITNLCLCMEYFLKLVSISNCRRNIDEIVLRLSAHAAALMMCQFSRTCQNKRISPLEVFDSVSFLTNSFMSLDVVESMMSDKQIRKVISKCFHNHVTFTRVSSKPQENAEGTHLFMHEY